MFQTRNFKFDGEKGVCTLSKYTKFLAQFLNLCLLGLTKGRHTHNICLHGNFEPINYYMYSTNTNPD